jgi:hypothetical protein
MPSVQDRRAVSTPPYVNQQGKRIAWNFYLYRGRKHAQPRTCNAVGIEVGLAIDAQQGCEGQGGEQDE